MKPPNPNIPDWAEALGRVPSGMFIVTVGRAGMLASWVQQCSFEPPLLTIAVARGRGLSGELTGGAKLAVNVLGDGDIEPVKHFGKGVEPGDGAFAGLEISHDFGPAPELTSALGVMQCTVQNRVGAGDHDLIVARVDAGGVRRAGQPAVHVRNSGLHY